MRMILALALASCSAAALADVKVETVDYKGWKDCARITNGEVEIVVVPQIGRIMRYGYVGGANILWENDALLGKTFEPDPRTHRNYGGDRLMLSFTSWLRNGDDVQIDGQPWTLHKIEKGVRLESPVGSKRVKFTRQITLSEVGTEATIENTMENRGERQQLAAMQSTLVNDPSAVTLPFEIYSAMPKGWHGFGRESLDPKYQSMVGGDIIIKRDPAGYRRFGARSIQGRLTAAVRSVRFTSEAPVFRTAVYPDGGSAQQVGTSADPDKYVELAHLTPQTNMERFELVFLTVRWRLAKG